MKKLIIYLCLPITVFTLSNAEATTICHATSVGAVNSCISNNGDNTTVVVDNNLSFTTGDLITINNRSNITVKGTTSAITFDETTARVTASSDLHMIKILNSSNIHIEDLIITSPLPTYNKSCGWGKVYFNAPCRGVIRVEDSNLVYVDSIEIDAKKTIQLEAQNVYDLYIQNSVFQNSATFGLWIEAAYPEHNEYVRVANNEFHNAGANAILLAESSHAWIGNNYFLNNHWDDQFFGYGGGQVLLEDGPNGHSVEVAITGNIIENTNLNSPASGVEIAHFDDGSIDGLEILWNTVKGHDRHAIYFNERDPVSDVSNAVIRNNSIDGNSTNIGLSDHAGVDISENLHGWATTATADFIGTAKTCTLASGESLCTITIEWNSSNVSNARLWVRSPAYGVTRQLFSSNASGQQDAPWIGSNGAIFELTSGNDTDNPYASINVKAVQ